MVIWSQSGEVTRRLEARFFVQPVLCGRLEWQAQRAISVTSLVGVERKEDGDIGTSVERTLCQFYRLQVEVVSVLQIGHASP